MNQSITTNKTNAWIESLRPRTLPLALASNVTGSALAIWLQQFKPLVALLALLTTALLQILSNLANDYGDNEKGTDTKERIGPLRGMQKGLISPSQMKKALILTIILTLLSGTSLIIVACETPSDLLKFMLLGLLAILAAITYTMGNKPYGYMGLGDLSVLIFFGWLGVAGTTYLHVGHFYNITLLPATACGLLAAAVLNINNLRDIESDRKGGKNTLAVRLGNKLARYYQVILLATALCCFIIFTLNGIQNWKGWLFLCTLPLFYQHGKAVLQQPSAVAMRPLLGQMVRLALLTNLLFSLGLILA